MISISEKNKEIALWGSVFLFLLLPSLFHACRFAGDAFFFLLTGSIVTAMLTGALMCMPWRVTRWAAFTVLFGFSLFELAHMLVYDGDIACTGYVRSLFMTTPYEADGALGRIIMQHIVFIVLLAVFYILVSIQIFLTSPIRRFSRWALTVSAVLVLIHLIASPSALVHRPPLNIFTQMSEALRQRNERDRLTAEVDTFVYHAQRTMPDAEKEVYLLIMDESLRYDHVSLSGSDYRVTMPRMGRLLGLVSYDDYFSSGVFTMYAVPMLVTRATPADFTLNYQEYGVQQAFAETGFKTIWLTNEAQLVSDGVSDYVARGAEIIRVKKDMDMPAVVDSLCAQYDRLFIIMHLWGNHQFYLNTDAATSRYYPDITTCHDVHGVEMYNNAYDNSILYTDSMLLALTKGLQRQHCPALWIFTSDHGEGPIGRNGGAHGYTHPYESEYHVPLMIWHSDEYAAAYPEKAANGMRHNDEPVCADHIFWSLLDMADIRIDSAMQQEGMSFFGDTLAPYRRMLLMPDGKNRMPLSSDN